MQQGPSIRGATLRGVCEAVRRLRDEARVPSEALESTLTPGDLALLEDKISDAAWYPVASYGRMLALLGHWEGGDQREYLRERGRAVLRRLQEAGVYVQLDALEHARLRIGQEDHGEALGRLRRMLTFAAMAFDFLESEADDWPGRPGVFRLRFRNAAELPDEAIAPIEGFIEGCIDLSTAEAIPIPPVRGRRTSADVVDFALDLGPLLRS